MPGGRGLQIFILFFISNACIPQGQGVAAQQDYRSDQLLARRGEKAHLARSPGGFPGLQVPGVIDREQSKDLHGGSGFKKSHVGEQQAWGCAVCTTEILALWRCTCIN